MWEEGVKDAENGSGIPEGKSGRAGLLKAAGTLPAFFWKQKEAISDAHLVPHHTHYWKFNMCFSLGYYPCYTWI